MSPCRSEAHLATRRSEDSRLLSDQEVGVHATLTLPLDVDLASIFQHEVRVEADGAVRRSA